MIVGYIGNFGPAHSTENHVKAAAERLGHQVWQLQENARDTWENLPEMARQYHLILWTRTGWDWPHDTGWSTEEAWERQDIMLDAAAEAGIPVVGFHLDRWWGLDREGQIHDEPFFRSSLVCTADGGHDQEWIDAGINHHWLPPGVSLAETEREGRTARRAYPGQVAFVGAHRLRQGSNGWDGYHDEWAPHRKAMLDACQAKYGRQFQMYPRGRALRGQPLADLYATIPVLVGDSCLAPIDDPPLGYWSDRIPETIGRGGILVHPDPQHGDPDSLLRQQFSGAPSLLTYPLGDYDEMLVMVEWALRDRDLFAISRREGRAWVQAHHTYERRIEQIIELVEEQELAHG